MISSSASESQLYSVLLAMAQKFVSRYPLIEGQGNFGSNYGDSPAAMRYTECRASKNLLFGNTCPQEYVSQDQLEILIETLEGLSSRTDLSVNELQRIVSDASTGKPDSRQAIGEMRFPNLLANGTLGLPGVNATIPPFNLKGIVFVLQTMIQQTMPDARGLVNLIGLPDFATGGIITNKDEAIESLVAGKGTICLSGRCEIGLVQEGKGHAISVFELPFGATVCELLDDLKAAGKIPGVKRVVDHTNYLGINVELQLTNQAKTAAVMKAIESLPSMSNEIPINVTVIEDEKVTHVTVPDLIHREYDRLLCRHDGKQKLALKELKELAKLDVEERRTQ